MACQKLHWIRAYSCLVGLHNYKKNPCEVLTWCQLLGFSTWDLSFWRELYILVSSLIKNSLQYLNYFFSHLIAGRTGIVVLSLCINMFLFLEETKSLGMEYLSLGDKLVEDGCIHIISLGSKALMIQVWADLNTGAFIFRYGVLIQKQSCEHMYCYFQ